MLTPKWEKPSEMNPNTVKCIQVEKLDLAQEKVLRNYIRKYLGNSVCASEKLLLVGRVVSICNALCNFGFFGSTFHDVFMNF